jgi:prolyl oligopeptidase
MLFSGCKTAPAPKATSNAKSASVKTPTETAVDDEFLWLEEVEGERALSWVKARNKESVGELEGDARYQPFYDKAVAIVTATDRIPYGRYRGGYVYNFWQDDKNVRGLWRRSSLEGYQTAAPEWETLLDFDELAKTEKENWVYKGVSCLPPNHSRCMIKLSRGGKDAGVYREFDLKTRSFVKDGFYMPEAKSAAAWVDENTLLVGTDWGEGSLTESGYPRTVRRWKRGTPLADAELLFEGAKEDVGTWSGVSHRPEGAITMVSRMTTFFTGEHWVTKGEGALRKLPIQNSAELQSFFQDQVLFSLREAWTVGDTTYAQGALLSFSLDAFLTTGKLPAVHTLFVPDERTSISSVADTKSSVYVTLLENVKGKLLRYEWNPEKTVWTSQPVDLPGTGTIALSSTDTHNDVVFINYEGYLKPDQLYVYDGGSSAPDPIKSLPERFNAAGATVQQLQATSPDGTKVPYFLVSPGGKTGAGPVLLYGYGGFEVSLTPRYMASFGKLWLERGGSFVIANIRGGGEFGPRWHKAALKKNRQRAFDDFIAVGEDLIKRELTTPKQLGIMGGSNGGLLMGASFTQRPDLFGAVVCQVPLLDMLRYTKLLAGASWAAEYGDPDDPEMRSVISKYSPYQNLEADKAYPRVFFLTSTKDDRVHPGHARKMVARMLSMGKPVYYYENTEGGHAASANQKQRARRLALEFVYLSRMLGLE